MTKKILIADDDDCVRELMIELMRAKGYETLEASDGIRAYTMVVEHEPDLIMLDVMLPSASGIEVCRGIKQSKTLRSTKVLIYSVLDHHKNRAFAYGADDYIQKPADTSVILEKVRDLLCA